MAAAERQLLAELGWQGNGLISAGSAATDGDQSAAAAAEGEVSDSQPDRSCTIVRVWHRLLLYSKREGGTSLPA